MVQIVSYTYHPISNKMAVPFRLNLLLRRLNQTMNLSYCNVSHFHKRAKEYSGVKVFRALANTEPQDEAVVELNPFGPVTESQKKFLDDLNPPLKRSFNLASYVNHSQTLQKLLNLGVSFFDIENTNMAAAKYLVNLDFEADCLPYIKFLLDNGLKEKNIGHFISEFPFVFQTPLDDLQARINYLESKGFEKKMIAKALNKSTHIIYHSTKTLDFKLGQLQVEFNLPADLLRSMVVQEPTIVSIPHGQYILVQFVLDKEFGFEQSEIYSILDKQPNIISIHRPVLIDRLDLVHNTLGINQAMIARYPKLITGPELDIRYRGLYLKKLKRDQYDPREPLYVPPSALYKPSDEIFCKQYAKTTLDDYFKFIKYS